jgi:esterase/lipase superfamily enzyme
MDFKYVDDNLPRWIEGWWSPTLGMDMPVACYGHRGHPLVIFPTAAADFLETERFFLIKAIEPQIFAGRVRVFSIDSINNLAWMDRHLPVPEKARRQALYVRYIEDELVPFIRHRCGDPGARIATTGASFGAFHAANAVFRRPDLFDGLIAMSGFYDLGGYFEGYSNDDCYFNNPAWYLPNLEGHALDLLRHHCQIYVVTGQGDWEKPEGSRRLSGILASKGIPHELDLWGYDMPHDWPTWRQMLPYAIDQKMRW